MFFPERIKSINDNDRVLEIGPGATPFHRSDVFLELSYDSEEERIAQSGHVGILESDKTIVYYDGLKFPFKDKEFDYVICSHVLEHVNNLPFFLKELQRISSKGYLEFPTIYYDYLHNIEEHQNMILVKNNTIYWCKKNKTPIPNLEPFTDFFRTLQRKNYRFQNEVNSLWHHGFEWFDKINEEEVEHWKKLTYNREYLENNIPQITLPTSNNEPLGIKSSLKQLFSAFKRKIK